MRKQTIFVVLLLFFYFCWLFAIEVKTIRSGLAKVQTYSKPFNFCGVQLKRLLRVIGELLNSKV